MEKKSGTVLNWILYSVIVVIIPIIFKIFAYIISFDKLPDSKDLFIDILLILLSISCSLFSISLETYRQKREKDKFVITVISAAACIITWSFYVFSFSEKIYNFSFIIICFCVVMILIFIFLGCKVGKSNESNYNNIIILMHNNCSKIREKLILKRINNHLESHVTKSNDLLCHPNKYNDVEQEIATCVKEMRGSNE